MPMLIAGVLFLKLVIKFGRFSLKIEYRLILIINLKQRRLVLLKFLNESTTTLIVYNSQLTSTLLMFSMSVI